jgi:hypothetical protein
MWLLQVTQIKKMLYVFAFTQTPPIREKLASKIEASEIRSASSSQCS